MKKSRVSPSPAFWLVKTEPSVFSIEDLARAKKRTTCWDGVRNYQARNYLRDAMRRNDRVLIYHSNANPSCVVGTGLITRTGYPDPTAWDPTHPHYDPTSDPSQPRWFMVDVTLESIFLAPLSLAELRTIPTLSQMELLRKGSRLSVQPVRPAEFAAIWKLGKPQTA